MSKCKITFDHFTKEQVQELSVQLAALSKKDTEFPDAKELTGDEKLAIVQDGDNALASVADVSNKVAEQLEPIIPTEATVAGWGFTKNTGDYTKPVGGIPKSDLTEEVQASLDKADSSYQKPNAGIPSTDMTAEVQASLGKADTALQEHQDISGKADKSEMAVVESGDKTIITLKEGLSAEVINQHQDLTPITDLIPAQATSSNKLADKEFVNSSVSTATATFQGTYTSTSQLPTTGIDENDYAFVVGTDSAGNTVYNRYKYSGGQWLFEYALNNSSFTAEQWAAIQSGITQSLVSKLSGIEANAQVNKVEGIQKNGIDITPDANRKVNVTVPAAIADLSEDTTHRVVTDAEKSTWNGKYTKPTTGIPASDLASEVQTSLGKAGTAYQKPSGGIPASDLASGVIKNPIIYMGTCDTASDTAAKVVTVQEFPLDSNNKPLVGTVIGVKFDNTNAAANATLNVNDTGAEQIWFNAAVYTSNSSFAGYADRYIYYAWDGTYWAWLSWGVDQNDTNGINIRTANCTRLVTDKTGRYRLLFSSADDSKWVPANSEITTNATAVRAVNQTPINPFGSIVYYNTTTIVNAGNSPANTQLWQQYSITLGYSFNTTGSALTMTPNDPVYVKCTPQSDGSAIMDSTTPIVFALPTIEDGKIYIYLGIVASATTITFMLNHPVYYFKDGAIREWTNQEKEIFWATYGTTTAAQIDAAVAAGKVVACARGDYIYVISHTDATYIYMTSAYSQSIYYVRIKRADNTWSYGSSGDIEFTSRKISSLSDFITNRTSETKYPSAKAAYDLVYPAIQSTQPQDGFAPNVEYNLGTLSGSVTFALATPVDATISNHYYWTFDTGSTAPTITWPSGITWYGGSAPTINASKHYEISVLNNIGVAMEV